MYVNKTKDVVAKVFGKTVEESLKQFPNIARAYKYVDFNHHPMNVTVSDTPSGGHTVCIGFQDMVQLIKFTLDPYPACCGNRLFHHFFVHDSYVTQEQLNEIMDTFFKENKYIRCDENTSGFLGYSNRIEVIMVEYRPGLQYKNDLVVVEQEVEPIADPQITYKKLWNFFHQYGKRVRTRREVNAGSGNVLHNMEVIF